MPQKWETGPGASEMGDRSRSPVQWWEAQPWLRVMERESARLSSHYHQQHYPLSTAVTIMHNDSLLYKDSATTKLASSFKLNTLKRAEISILHLFTDEKTFPNRQRSHFFFFYSKDGQLFPVISITFPTYYFM